MTLPGHPKNAANDWLDRFRAQAGSSSTTILAVGASLLVAAFAVVLPTYIEMSKAVQIYEKRDLEVVSELKANLIRDGDLRPVRTTSTSATVAASSGDLAELLFLEQASAKQLALFERLDKRISDLTTERDSVRQNATLEFFGTKFQIPKTMAVLAWSSILAWLLVYVDIKRNLLARAILKAKQRFEVDLIDEARSAAKRQASAARQQAPAAVVSDIAGDAPFWLSPVQSLRLTEGEQDQLLTALDTTHQSDRRTGYLSAGLVALFLAFQAVAAGIGFLITDESAVAAKVAGFPWGETNRILPLLSDLTLSATVVVILWFSYRWIAPAPLRGFVGRVDRWIVARCMALVTAVPALRPIGGFLVSRRLLVAGALASLGTMVAAERLISWAGVTRPARARKHGKNPQGLRTLPTLAEGFYKVDRPAFGTAAPKITTYYVDETRSTWVAPGVAEDRFIRVADPAAGEWAILATLSERHWEWAVEHAALLRAGPARPEALALLRAALRNESDVDDRRRMRLWDLLAILSKMTAGSHLDELIATATPLATEGSPLYWRLRVWGSKAWRADSNAWLNWTSTGTAENASQ